VKLEAIVLMLECWSVVGFVVRVECDVVFDVALDKVTPEFLEVGL
jgi:hypothetical protein